MSTVLQTAAIAIETELSDLLTNSGLMALVENAPIAEVETALRALAELIATAEPVRRAAVREVAIRQLKVVGIGSPAAMVDAALGRGESKENGTGGGILFDDLEPWPAPVDGAALLDSIRDTFSRYVILPIGASVALALWIIHTYALDAAECSPVLAITSPEKRCGKTVVLEVLQSLACRPLPASNITAPALFRTIQTYKPTILIDEADSFLRDNEELRGVLNSGHRPATAFVLRTSGDDHEPTMFSTWAAKAIALIGALPGTLADRSITIAMRRKGPGESVARLRYRTLKAETLDLRRCASQWAEDNLTALSNVDPDVPDLGSDRSADCWRPLLAIADQAGAGWPKLARQAAVTLSTGKSDDSDGVRLLTDIREMFASRGTDRLASEDVVKMLVEMEDKKYPEWRNGKPITKTQLARALGKFDVTPKSVRIAGHTPKGYDLAQFEDAFSRYIPFQSATPPQINTVAGLDAISKRNASEGVALSKQEIVNTVAGCGGVALPEGEERL